MCLLRCSDAGVPVLVDGAHSVGALHDLRVPDLGCAYFVSTLHKWLCTPKVNGSCFTVKGWVAVALETVLGM